MLSPDLVPTLLIKDKERKPLDIEPPLDPRGRTLSIVKTLIKFGFRIFWLVVRRKADGAIVGRVTRMALQELGFLWIKVGQILSLRRDVLGEPFCRELGQLQSRAPGFPLHMAVDIITKELGVPPSEIFAEFDEMPFAAASIGQVHFARLKDGRAACIKVRRPFAEELFAKDMRFVRTALLFFTTFRIFSFMRWDEMVWELSEIMSEEIDYRYELNNLQRMHKTLKKHKVHVPDVFPRYCTRRVLTMERVAGVLMSEYIFVRNSDPMRARHWEEENNITPKVVGERLNFSFLRQLFEDELFHGDVHPGNVLLLRDSYVCLLDYGSVGTPKRDLWRTYMELIRAMAERDYNMAANHILSLAPKLPVVDIPDIQEAITRCFRTWERKTNNKQLDYHEKSLTAGLTSVLEILARNRIMISWAFLKIDRTWGTLDATLYYMLPEVNYPKLFRKYFKQRQRRMLKATLSRDALRYQLTEVPERIGSFVALLEPQLRRGALMFEAAQTRASLVVKEIVRTFVVLDVLAMAFIGLVWSKQHGGLEHDGTSLLHQLAAEVPFLEHHIWVAIFAGAMLVAWQALRVAGRLTHKGVRLPGDSQTYE